MPYNVSRYSPEELVTHRQNYTQDLAASLQNLQKGGSPNTQLTADLYRQAQDWYKKDVGTAAELARRARLLSQPPAESLSDHFTQIYQALMGRK